MKTPVVNLVKTGQKAENWNGQTMTYAHTGREVINKPTLISYETAVACNKLNEQDMRE